MQILERIRAYSAVAATKAGNTKRFNVKRTRRKEITSVLKAISHYVFFVKAKNLKVFW